MSLNQLLKRDGVRVKLQDLPFRAGGRIEEAVGRRVPEIIGHSVAEPSDRDVIRAPERMVWPITKAVPRVTGQSAGAMPWAGVIFVLVSCQPREMPVAAAAAA